MTIHDTPIRLLAASLFALMAGAATAADQPQDVIIVMDFAADNGAISGAKAQATGTAVADLIAGLALGYGDRITLTGIGTPAKGWDNAVYELAYKGAQPKDAPAFIAARIAALGDETRTSNDPADALWAIERLPTSCTTRKTTLVVVADMMRAGTTDGATSFAMEGIPGTPHDGCARLAFFGIGAGSTHPKGVIRAAEDVMLDLGKMIGVRDVDVQH